MIGALERAMEKAWGLHRAALFKDIGDNRFVVRFSSEGDWRHVMRNGPWQFDFNPILLQKFDGSIRPSDMVFNSLDVWVRVLDLPLDKMNRAYGELIGNWVGKFISVEVDEDGMAWGEDLRIRAEIRVGQPLMRGVNLRSLDEDVEGSWFDLQYEKIPHFCFDCGCLVHPDEGCQGEGGEVKQWGEWLWAEPRKTRKSPPRGRPAFSSSSFSSWSAGSDSWHKGTAFVRDLPPKRNQTRDYSFSSSSRTGGNEVRRHEEEATSPEKRHGARASERVEAKTNEPPLERRTRAGTYVRVRKPAEQNVKGSKSQAPQGTGSRKRGQKQVWMPINVQVIGEGSSESQGKRQRTGSVFDRLEEQGVEQTGSVFDRLEDPAADPAVQGRREQ
jgi:hypothetical protein